MKYYKIKYADGNFKIVKGKNSLEVIKKYDLCTREQEAITISNEQ